MKKCILFITLLGLGLSACKKEEITKADTEPIEENSLSINGETYSVQFITKTAAYILNLSSDKFSVNIDRNTIDLKEYDMSIPLTDLSSDLKRIKNENK